MSVTKNVQGATACQVGLFVGVKVGLFVFGHFHLMLNFTLTGLFPMSQPDPRYTCTSYTVRFINQHVGVVGLLANSIQSPPKQLDVLARTGQFCRKHLCLGYDLRQGLSHIFN